MLHYKHSVKSIPIATTLMRQQQSSSTVQSTNTKPRLVSLVNASAAAAAAHCIKLTTDHISFSVNFYDSRWALFVRQCLCQLYTRDQEKEETEVKNGKEIKSHVESIDSVMIARLYSITILFENKQRRSEI